MFAVIYQNIIVFNQNTIILIETRVSLLNNKFKSFQLRRSQRFLLALPFYGTETLKC